MLLIHRGAFDVFNPVKGRGAFLPVNFKSEFVKHGVKSLVALGVRRNFAIPANANPDWYDLGMCGPERTDFSARDEYCARFMTPSLRNVATRRVFFHNGVIHSLREAVAFYVKRDQDPGKFDDLPIRYRKNIEMDAPFGQPAGRPSVLTGEEIDDIVAFLKTLTDGYRSPP